MLDVASNYYLTQEGLKKDLADRQIQVGDFFVRPSSSWMVTMRCSHRIYQERKGTMLSWVIATEEEHQRMMTHLLIEGVTFS